MANNKLDSRNYRRASKNLHNTVVRLIRKYKGKNVIDLGSGRLGIAYRLEKLGINITIADIDNNQNNSDTIKCVKQDLREKITIKKKYDIVTCTEVIEHLPNSRKLFFDAYTLLEDGGYFIVTTPNNQNWFGRIWFLFSGKFPMFNGKLHEPSFNSHITPIFDWQLKMISKDIFTYKETTFNRSVIPFIKINLPIKNLFFGQNLVMVFKKRKNAKIDYPY